MTGLEPLIFESAKSLTGIVIKSAWEKGNGLFKRIKIDEAIQQRIFNASRRYIENYAERHGILKVLGMREPVKLEAVYTAVQFLDEMDIQLFESIESLERAYRETKYRSFQINRPKQDGLKIANEKQYLMVLGGPGAGKSTFLRRIGLEALKGQKGKFDHSCVPVFVELRDFKSGDIDIKKLISNEFQVCGFPSPEESANKLLQQGKLLILLDGLDEVPTSEANIVITKIQNFVDVYDKNRFIASCRVAAYRHNFRRFTDVAIAEFDDIQIKNFIANWFRDDPNRGKECWQKLSSPEQQAVKELTQTPLLLTLLCLLYQRSLQFPDNRATLYERALRVLLEEWAAEKGIPSDQIYKGLDTKRKELVLSEIAYHAFQADHLFLSRRELTNQIENLLKEILPDEKFIDGSAFLRAIEVQHGVLVERAEGIYSFSHLTFQEYLTAQYIDDNRQIGRLVSEHLHKERWREVFLLVAGLMRGGADELLILMEKQAQIYINTPKLEALLKWADQVTNDSKGNRKTAANRALAVFLSQALSLDLTRSIDLARTLALALDMPQTRVFALSRSLARSLDLALDFTLALDSSLPHEFEKLKAFQSINLNVLAARLESLKTKIPDNNQPIEVRRAFAEKILQTWLDIFNLPKELTQISRSECEALENYVYSSWLILQCKQAAVRKPKVWESIEERMLRVAD